MPRYGVLDQDSRQVEKAQARRADAEDLRSGRVSPAEMTRRNGFFSALDMRGARIAAIGAREVSASRSKKS